MLKAISYFRHVCISTVLQISTRYENHGLNKLISLFIEEIELRIFFGVIFILAGLFVGFLSLRKDLILQSLPVAERVRVEVENEIATLLNENLKSQKVKSVRYKIRSQTLRYLLGGRELRFNKNEDGKLEIEFDIFDIVTDDEVKGFVVQASVFNLNQKNKNKEMEFLKNIELKSLNKVYIRWPKWMSDGIKPY